MSKEKNKYVKEASKSAIFYNEREKYKSDFGSKT
jgi:hypothetical protein